MGKVRKRSVKETQKAKPDEKEKTKPTKEESAPKAARSNNGVIIILVLMIGITWGIAATSYFGVVDYKGLIGLLQKSDEPSPAAEVPPVTPETQDVGEKKEPEAPKEDKPTEKESDDKPKSNKESEEKPKPKPSDGKEESGKDKEKAKKKPKITVEEDKPILQMIKEGETLLAQKKAETAYKIFKQLCENNPNSPRARFGRARSEAMLAEQQKSNPLLAMAIKTYQEVVDMSNAPKEIKKRSLIQKSEKEMFLGRMKPALATQIELAKLYPWDLDILNKLGVRYMMLGQNRPAKAVYEKALKIKPDDGFALVHMGFILKQAGSWAESIRYLQQGTESNEPGTQEGKFYFHLGDALHRTNRTEEAQEVYDKAAKKGLFRSKYQRSLYNVDRLTGRPFWTPEEAGVEKYVKRLQLNWKVIRDEGLAILDAETGLFQLEEESLRDTGEWRQFTLFQRGVRHDANCQRTPKTCDIIERMPNAKGCRRGQVKYSVMMPGTHVWPHTGPTNCRLRMHLGLVIPTTGSGARMQCAGEMRTWEEGKVFIFDDSFEHEVWQEAESLRLILMVDVWHPELTEQEKRSLSTI